MNLRTLPIVIDPRALSLAEGLRAGLAVALMVGVGSLFDLPHLGLAALGALLTCFADPGGPVARRLPAVFSFVVLSGLVYAGFSLLRGAGIWVAAPVAGFAIFCTSFARIYGQGGMQVGNLLSVVTVLGLDHAAPPALAVAHGLNLSAGGLWAAALTLAIWRIHPYAPARRAVAEVCRRLSRLAAELARLAGEEETAGLFEAHAAQHRGAVREAVEAARNVAGLTFRGRGLLSRHAQLLSVRLRTLEQIFTALIALSDAVENDRAGGEAALRAIRLVAGWLGAIGPDIAADAELDSLRRRQSLERLRREAAKFGAESELRHLLELLAERLAVMVGAAAPSGEAAAEAGSKVPLRQRLVGPVRANLSIRSIPFRHALRAGLVAAPALLWTMSRHQVLAHWMAITLVLCLQPYFSGTWVRTAERVVGTTLGGVLAALIGLFAREPLVTALTMLPVTMFAFAIRAVSFTAFTAALTPMIVLLIEQLSPGASDLAVALLRIGYTVLGGCIAILANALLFPGFESARVEASTEAAIAAHVAYLEAVFATLLGEPAAVPDTARRAAGLASNNLEASLSRAILEPHRRAEPGIGRGTAVDAALRRMAGRLSVMLLDRPAIADPALWRLWRRYLAATLKGEGGGLARPGLPEGAAGEALTRLARQAELAAG